MNLSSESEWIKALVPEDDGKEQGSKLDHTKGVEGRFQNDDR